MEMNQQKGDSIYPLCIHARVHCSGTWTPWTLTNDHRYEPRKILLSELIEMVQIKNVANVNANANTSRYNQFKWTHQTFYVATIPQAPLSLNIFCIWLTSFMSLQQLALAWESCSRRNSPRHGGQHQRWGFECNTWQIIFFPIFTPSRYFVFPNEVFGACKNFWDMRFSWMCDIVDMKTRQLSEDMFKWGYRNIFISEKVKKAFALLPPSHTHTHTPNSHTHTHTHTPQFFTLGLGWSIPWLGLAPAEVTREF